MFDPFDKVREQYKVLETEIDSLPGKISEVEATFESQFLLSYRAQVRSIQEELKALNDKINIAQIEFNDNAEVAKLESLVSWFKKETEKFEEHIDDQIDNIDELNDDTLSLQEQNQLLYHKLKELMKYNTYLSYKIKQYKYSQQRAQSMPYLDSRGNHNPILPKLSSNSIKSSSNLNSYPPISSIPYIGHNHDNSYNDINNTILSDSQLEFPIDMPLIDSMTLDEYHPHHTTTTTTVPICMTSSLQSIEMNTDNDINQSKVQSEYVNNSGNLLISNESHMLDDSITSSSSLNIFPSSMSSLETTNNDNHIHIMELQCEKQKTALSSSAIDLTMKRSDIETALNEALLSISKDIIERKRVSTASFSRTINKKSMSKLSSLPRPLTSTSSSPSLNTSLSLSAIRTIKNGITGYELESMTSADKLNTIVLFLSNPKVFCKVIRRYEEWSRETNDDINLDQNSGICISDTYSQDIS